MGSSQLEKNLHEVIGVFQTETPRLIKCMKKFCAKDQVHKINEVLKNISDLRRTLKHLDKDLKHSDRALSSVLAMIELLDRMIKIHKILLS